jgi:hypothetical protein
VGLLCMYRKAKTISVQILLSHPLLAGLLAMGVVGEIKERWQNTAGIRERKRESILQTQAQRMKKQPWRDVHSQLSGGHKIHKKLYSRITRLRVPCNYPSTVMCHYWLMIFMYVCLNAYRFRFLQHSKTNLIGFDVAWIRYH